MAATYNWYIYNWYVSGSVYMSHLAYDRSLQQTQSWISLPFSNIPNPDHQGYGYVLLTYICTALYRDIWTTFCRFHKYIKTHFLVILRGNQFVV